MRPRDPDRPLVCLDETSKQLIAETRVPIPMKPGRAARVDYEYERNGTANLFMLFAPLEGWRHVKVTDRHTAVDYAHVLKDLADIHFPHARPSCSSRTISTFTARRHFTRFSRRQKRDGWLSASNGTTTAFHGHPDHWCVASCRSRRSYSRLRFRSYCLHGLWNCARSARRAQATAAIFKPSNGQARLTRL